MIRRVYTRSTKLNRGNTSLGFTVDEMVGEYIDNEIDACAQRILVKLFKEEYTMQSDNLDETIDLAERYGFAIVGDGNSFTREELEDLFKFGYINGEYEVNINKNSKFRYGTISGLGSGNSVIIITKKFDETNWKVKEIHFNEHELATYESNVYELTSDEVRSLLFNHDIEMNIEYGTIALIKGIEKRKIGEEEKFISELNEFLSLTYNEYLSSKEIKLANTQNEYFELEGIDPIGLSLSAEIKSSVFLYKEIRLAEIFNRLDAIEKYQLSKEISNLSQAVIDNAKIQVKLCKIGINKKNKKSIRKKYPDLSNFYYPSPSRAGIYLKRVGRYIGQAVGAEIFGKAKHPSQNLLRGEIEFSPIFDRIFGVQMNKNRNSLDGIIREILEELILTDDDLVGTSVFARVLNVLGEGVTETTTRRELSDEEKRERARIKINKIEGNLRRYHQDLACITRVKNLIDNDENTEAINMEILMIETKYANDLKKRYNDIDIMIKRVKELKSLKVLSDTVLYESFEGLIEANIEIDVYGAFVRLYSEAPELFDFEPLMYDTQKGIDYLVKLDENVYEQLGMPRRIGELEKTICQELEIAKSRYSYVEFKNVLGEEMNHSLELVSHIVCWRRKKGLSEIITDYGRYRFNDRRDMIINEDGNKVKVIYMRELLKKVTRGSWISNDIEED